MTPLDHLITSRVLAKAIKHFCNAHKPTGTRNLARQLREDNHNVWSALKRLEKAGLIENVVDEGHPEYMPVQGYYMDCLRELSRKPYKENV